MFTTAILNDPILYDECHSLKGQNCSLCYALKYVKTINIKFTISDYPFCDECYPTDSDCSTGLPNPTAMEARIPSERFIQGEIGYSTSIEWFKMIGA